MYNGQASRRPRFPFEFPRKSINGNISLPSLPQRIYILSGRGMYDITNGCLSISRTLYTRPLSLLRTVVRYYRNYSSCRGAGYQRDYPWVCYHCLEKQRRKENGESWEDSFLKRKEDSFLLLYPVEINSEVFGRKFLFESFSAVIFKFIFQVRTWCEVAHQRFVIFQLVNCSDWSEISRSLANQFHQNPVSATTKHLYVLMIANLQSILQSYRTKIGNKIVLQSPIIWI